MNKQIIYVSFLFFEIIVTLYICGQYHAMDPSLQVSWPDNG